MCCRLCCVRGVLCRRGSYQRWWPPTGGGGSNLPNAGGGGNGGQDKLCVVRLDLLSDAAPAVMPMPTPGADALAGVSGGSGVDLTGIFLGAGLLTHGAEGA